MIIIFFLIQLKCRQYLNKWLFISLCPGSTEMVSAILEAGCDTSVKMGIPATVTPMSLATDLGLEDITELLSKASISWQFCPFPLSSLEKYCVLLRWSVISHNMCTVTLWKLAERALFQGGEAPVVVVEGEGGARMVLQVPPHYSLGGGALQRPSNPDPIYSKSKNNTKNTLLKSRDLFSEHWFTSFHMKSKVFLHIK